MTFGRWTILDRFDFEGGGFDALARDETGREARLWVGQEGSAAESAEALDALRQRLARIYHASLPTVLGADRTSGRAVLILQPYRGTRLSDLLAKTPPDAARAIDLVRPVAAALVKAHKAGVAHGALDANELLVSEDGRTLLLHLGWGPFLGPRAPRAPADIGGTEAAEAGDVFALSRVLVRSLEGQDRFENTAAFWERFRTAPPRDPASFPPELPEGMRRLLARALHPDPERRMRRAEELAGDLGVLRASWDSLHQAPPRPAFPFPPLLHPAVLAGALAALMLAAVLLLRSCGGENPG